MTRDIKTLPKDVRMPTEEELEVRRQQMKLVPHLPEDKHYQDKLIWEYDVSSSICNSRAEHCRRRRVTHFTICGLLRHPPTPGLHQASALHQVHHT